MVDVDSKSRVESGSDPNVQLDSDKRFGSLRWLAERARMRAGEHQLRHVKELEARLDDDDSINLFSVIREPNGVGGTEMSLLLEQDKSRPRIVLLMNGLVNPQDIVQVSPTLEKLGMAALRVLSKTRDAVGDDLGVGLRGDTISGYLARTIKRIQKDLFNGEDCDVLLVFNSSKQDLHDVIALGGSNTALVVGGHGTLGSLSMTDGDVSNDEIATPDEPLHAFLQHTCAGPSDCQEEMGSRWANEVYGWRRGTSPIDFIDNPLNERG